VLALALVLLLLLLLLEPEARNKALVALVALVALSAWPGGSMMALPVRLVVALCRRKALW
jgi:hypothetical protein